VDCKKTLPHSRVDQLDTNHSMQKYGEKNRYPRYKTESVDCRQTLPRSKVDHLYTNHRMQQYGGKQITKIQGGECGL